MAAIDAGAGSWSAVGRQAGCSRQWARVLAEAAGRELTAPRAPRTATLSVRVRGAALAELDAFAATESVRAGRPVRRSEAARLLLGEALTARRVARERRG